jgi:hypothetical protein
LGPTSLSSVATDWRRATEMFHGPSWRQAIPSRSQASQKIPWMSSDRFEKK